MARAKELIPNVFRARCLLHLWLETYTQHKILCDGNVLDVMSVMTMMTMHSHMSFIFMLVLVLVEWTMRRGQRLLC